MKLGDGAGAIIFKVVSLGSDTFPGRGGEFFFVRFEGFEFALVVEGADAVVVDFVDYFYFCAGSFYCIFPLGYPILKLFLCRDGLLGVGIHDADFRVKGLEFEKLFYEFI